jgi:hypothetical protein
MKKAEGKERLKNIGNFGGWEEMVIGRGTNFK